MPWSPELETLDQLLGGDLCLATIRTFYPSDERFGQAMVHLLKEGDVSLLSSTESKIPEWRWSELFRSPTRMDLNTFKVRVTEQGARKIS